MTENNEQHYNYDKQAWVMYGVYQKCGHTNEDCGCYGRDHQGEHCDCEDCAQD